MCPWQDGFYNCKDTSTICAHFSPEVVEDRGETEKTEKQKMAKNDRDFGELFH